MSDQIKLEKPDGRYCNLESKECKDYGQVFVDDDGYICARCGGRVSKWITLCNVITKSYKKE